MSAIAESRGYGWKPGLPDQRDLFQNFHGAEVAASVDLRSTGHLPNVWDQGNLGSCTSHGAPVCLVYDLAKNGKISDPDDFMPSRLFHYYFERVLEGTASEDSGATISDAFKVMNRYGLPPESEWPYDIAAFAKKPSAAVTKDAVLREAVKYAQVTQSATAMKACLSADCPIAVGFTVYESFESDATARTGDVPMPGSSEAVLGGHCVAVVGYTKRAGKDVWICRNSWGAGWGDAGYFYMPQGYLTSTSLASDFWTVQLASSPDPGPQPPQPKPPVPPTPPTPADADAALWSAAKAWAAKKGLS